jgi:hypothetical protein
MKPQTLSIIFIVPIAFSATSLCSAQASGPEAPSYGQQLAQVYGTYQGLLARKEACDEGLPATRAATDKSYAAWRARHAKLIVELDERLTGMIRGASRDDKEYARNIGKYEGAMLQQRQEAKQALLEQPRDELQALCRSLPQLLMSKDSDLETIYAEELKSIRNRR